MPDVRHLPVDKGSSHRDEGKPFESANSFFEMKRDEYRKEDLAAMQHLLDVQMERRAGRTLKRV